MSIRKNRFLFLTRNSIFMKRHLETMDTQRILKLLFSSSHKDRDLAEALVESLIDDQRTETLIQINLQLIGDQNHFDQEVMFTKNRVEKKINVYLAAIQ